MERGLRDLEEEIQMLKSNGALSTEEREEEMKQMEVYRSHSKFMKNKVWNGYFNPGSFKIYAYLSMLVIAKIYFMLY